MNAIWNEEDEEAQRLFQILELAYLKARYEPTFKVCAQDVALLTDKIKSLQSQAEQTYRSYYHRLDRTE